MDENLLPSELIDLGKESLELDFLTNENYDILQRLIVRARDEEKGFIYGVRDKDQNLMAGIFCLYDFGRIINLFSVTGDGGRKTAANYKLMDHIFEKYAGEARIFDFEGSMVESIAYFFEKFGAKKENYNHLYLNRLPFYLKWLKKN